MWTKQARVLGLFLPFSPANLIMGSQTKDVPFCPLKSLAANSGIISSQKEGLAVVTPMLLSQPISEDEARKLN